MIQGILFKVGLYGCVISLTVVCTVLIFLCVFKHSSFMSAWSEREEKQFMNFMKLMAVVYLVSATTLLCTGACFVCNLIYVAISEL